MYITTPPLEDKVPVTIGSADPCLDTLALKYSLNFCELMQMALNSYFIFEVRL